MKKFYTKLLLAMSLLLTSSAFAQVTGLAADDANPCLNQTVNVSWALGSGGGGPYFIQVGTTGPGSQNITSGSQPSNNFQVIAQVAGQTYYVTVTGQDMTPSTVTLMTEAALVAPTSFTVDGGAVLKVCANTTFDLAAAGGSSGTKQTAEWSTDNFGTIAFTSNPYTANYNVAGGIAVPTTYYVRYNSTCPGSTPTSVHSAVVNTFTAPTAPTQIDLQSTPFCPNVSTQFVATGGSLGDNPDNYAEFSFDNGGSWSQTSTYTATSGENVNADVRFYDACAMSTVASVNGVQLLVANTASVAPATVTVTAGDPYCSGIDNVTFQANGATLGTGGFYEYSVNGGAWVNNAGSNTHTVTPGTGSSVTVAFRVTDDCATTTSAQATATAYVNPTAVTTVTATPSGNVCMGTVVTYQANGALGNNPGSEYRYQVNGGGWVSNGANNFVAMAVNASTTVEFDIFDGCTAALLGTPAQVTTNLATNNVAPTMVTPSATTTCGVQTVTFTTDGTRGDNAEYQYSTDGGGSWTITPSTPTAGEGTFDLSITADVTVMVRISGGCNDVSATTVSSGAIDFQAANVAPTSLMASATSVCDPTVVTFTAQGSTLGDGAVYQYQLNGGGWINTLNAGADNFIDLNITANSAVDMRISGGCNDVSATVVTENVTYQNANTAPTSLTPSAASVCGSTLVTFTANGGTLGDAAVYEYSTDNGANWTSTGNAGIDNFIDLTITSNTTVDMRINGGCNDVSATVVSTSVTYSEPSVAPTLITAVDGNSNVVTTGSSICPNTQVTFTASGYTVGTGATFEYSADNGSTWNATGNAGADDFVTFTVMASNTYDVLFRLVGGCNGTQTYGTFTVTGYEAQPTVTSVTIDKDNFCANSGEVVTFTTYTSATVNNPPYTYEWYIFDPNTNTYSYLLSDTDGDLQLVPTATTTYAVRIEGCGVTSPYVATLVTVKKVSVAPTSISVSPNDTVCSGVSVALTANGGSAGAGAVLEWFDGTNTVGFGNPFFINPTVDVSLTARYNGECNTTAYVAPTMDIHVRTADDITVMNGTVCANSSLNLNTLVTPTGGTFAGTGVSGSTFSYATPGTYTITYTKTFAGGCVFSKDFDVTVTALPSVAISGIMPSGCSANDGEFTATGSGGAGGYDYSRDNGTTYPGTGASYTFSGLTSGSYLVVARDVNGCVSPAVTATIANTSGLALTTTSTNVSCNGGATGSITADVSNTGLAPHVYAISTDGGATWSADQSSPTFTGLVAGTYDVRVTDSNSPACTDFDVVAITEPAAGLDLTVDTYTDVTCFGGNDGSIANVQANGGTAPYMYSINPGGSGFGTATSFNNLSAGVYTITVKDANQCTAPFSFSIEEPSEIVSNVTTLDYNATEGYDIKISRSGGTGSLVVSFNGGAFTLDSLFNNIQPGTYSYTVKDNSNCTHTETFTLVDPSSVGAINKNVDLSVYPNPFSDVIQITGVDTDAQLTLINIYGQVVALNKSVNGNNIVINASELAKGMYILKIKANGQEVSRKLIKE